MDLTKRCHSMTSLQKLPERHDTVQSRFVKIWISNLITASLTVQSLLFLASALV